MMMTKFKWALLLIVSCSLTAMAQDTAPLTNWLKNNAASMGGRAYLMVYHNGKMVYSGGVNSMTMKQKMAARMMARRMGNEANVAYYTATTRQPIASCSKWLSAALVMTFVDEGKLRLTDSVGKYLPALAAAGKGSITIEQCLSHRTGIKAPPLKESLAGWKNYKTMDDAIVAIAAEPMEGQPGKVFHYSNEGLQIAGAVIEKIGGKPFNQLFLDRIAKPLGMADTDFGNNAVAMPAGGAGSTPHDYMNFLAMILSNGVFEGKRILTEASIKAMQINYLTADVKIGYSPAEAGALGYGLGEWVSLNQNEISSPGLFGSFPWVNKQKGYVAFLMTFYVAAEGKQSRYAALNKLVDQVVDSK